MKTVKKTLLTLAVLSVPVTAMAMPSLRDDCQFSSPIQSGGADILFSQNCKTAYVAPPNTGKVTLSGYHETQGTEFCGNLDNAKATYDQSQTRSKTWRDKSETLLLQVDPLIDEKIQANADLLELKGNIDYWVFEELKNSYEMALLAYNGRYDDYKFCLQDGLLTREECQQNLRDTVQAYSDARTEYNRYRSDNRVALAKIDGLKADIVRLDEQIVALEERVIKYDDYAMNIESRATYNYIDLASIYGANAKMLYTLDYDSYVDGIRAQNAHIPQITSWKQMPLVGAEFFTNMNPDFINAADPNMGSLKDLTPIHTMNTAQKLISFRPKGFSNLYESMDGEDKSTEPGAYMNNIDPNDVDALVYGSFGSASSNLAMNLFGACPLKKEGVTGTQLAASFDSYVQTGLRLQWLIEVPFGYKAQYKAHNILSQFSSNKSSGFLFWKKRKSSFYEWAKNTQDLKIEFIDPPLSRYWTEEMEETVRESIMRRIAFGVLDSVYPRISAAPLNDAEHQAWSKGAQQIGCSFGPYGCAIGWVVGSLDNRKNYSRFYSDKSRYYTEESTKVTYLPKEKYLTFSAQ